MTAKDNGTQIILFDAESLGWLDAAGAEGREPASNERDDC
jgi:hypothetical protein